MEEQPPKSISQLYRKSTIGTALLDSLDEMINSGELAPELANTILGYFDESIHKGLEERIHNKITFKGHLHTYRLAENVWTLVLQDAVFKVDSDMNLITDMVRIVATEGDTAQKPDE
eukprot:TRINITY_DN3950_c0_g1_i1.p1 TRINITY_DN3950_c0_g1~~TRINITY_DN3950_c0_g1_i1.p1  ORF type:complete len:117 (-),score=10.20 TRINITY_DN3950_c0_g1_i1:80-430(-)